MLSTYIRAAQLVELAIYAIVARALDMDWGATAVFVLAAFALVRMAFICGSFGLAHLHRSPRPPQLRIGPAAALAMVVREWLWLLAFNALMVPWERRFLRADPGPAPSPAVPVVLVHGYFANRGYFRPLVARLEAAGLSPVFVPNLRSWHAGIERFEEELGAALARIHQGCGQRAIVIAHSMGGLGIRAHLARHGAAHVERVITIGSPHHGTALARFGIGANARQMQPGSAFLAALEAQEGAAGPGIPALSIYTVHDNMVAPQETSRLPWARNVAVKGRGHLESAFAPEVVDLLMEELRVR